MESDSPLGVAPVRPVRVLLVDDDVAVRRAYEHVLVRGGMQVDAACGGEQALARIEASPPDVIVSDISMPRMTGTDFLKAVRAIDLDVPVILMTGNPGVPSAMLAVENGAFRYLAKPVAGDVLRDLVVRAAKLHELARIKRQALELPGSDGPRFGERASLEVRFSWAMNLMWMAWQPIVAWRERRVFGYEALLRSEEPLMNNPAAILDAAERLGSLHDLGRAVRARVAGAAAQAPEGAKLFVNLHSSDLSDEELYAPSSPLSKVAANVVLEVTERASLYGVKDVAARVASLKALGFQIAIDDLGAGYAGLTSFTQLDPQIAKLDMSLVRNVDTDPRRQAIVRSMKTLCADLGIRVVAEGVETPAERDVLGELGCELLQGYLFAKPQRAFEAPRW